MASLVAGNTVYVRADATYALAANYTLSTNAESNAISVIGYATVRTTSATGTDRPLFACGAYFLSFGNGWRIHNLRFTGTGASLVTIGYGSFTNCFANNSSATADRSAFGSTSSMAMIWCEATSAAGRGVTQAGAFRVDMYGCYIHDCGTYGIVAGGGSVVRSIFDACATGIYVGGNYQIVYGSIVYGCTTGIDLTGKLYVRIHNNVLASCTTAVTSVSYSASNDLDWNNWYGNTADISNVNKGRNCIAVDPAFTDAANGNFTTTAAGLRAVGVPGVMPGATSTTNYEDIGLQQLATGGAAGTRACAGGF
jgi:hypothetical protein